MLGEETRIPIYPEYFIVLCENHICFYSACELLIAIGEIDAPKACPVCGGDGRDRTVSSRYLRERPVVMILDPRPVFKVLFRPLGVERPRRGDEDDAPQRVDPIEERSSDRSLRVAEEIDMSGTLTHSRVYPCLEEACLRVEGRKLQSFRSGGIVIKKHMSTPADTFGNIRKHAAGGFLDAESMTVDDSVLHSERMVI